MGLTASMSVVLVSLGCAKNLVDSEHLLGLLRQAGYEVRATALDAGDLARWLRKRRRGADLCVVNTCGFIAAAKEESVAAILELGRLKAQGRLRALVAAGCLAQRYAPDLMAEVPELDAVVGTGEMHRVVEVARAAMAGQRVSAVGEPACNRPGLLPRVRLTPRFTAYLKIAEGCDHRCTFCAIPAIRGSYRSRDPGEVVAEAAALARSGVRELNLVAQDCTYYGVDREGRSLLPDLLRALEGVPGLRWIRLLYNYPTTFSPEILSTLAGMAKACHYVDIPMQHGSDRILAAMGRGAGRRALLKRLEAIRAALPNAAVRSSFIVGFPGETEADFRELLAFLDEAQLDYGGFFAFSPEEGTPAAALPGQVPDEVKEERLHRAAEHQRSISRRRNEGRVGMELEVLVEGRERGGADLYRGRWRGQAPEVDGQVIFRAPGRRLRPGALVKVRITHADDYDLYGEEAPAERRNQPS